MYSMDVYTYIYTYVIYMYSRNKSNELTDV